MKIVPASFEILDFPPESEILKKIELAGRTCYKSEDKITDDSAKEFVRRIIKSGHESVLEHASATVRIIADRGFLAEISRHRVGIALSVESTRYCNYSADKFGKEITVIKPHFWQGCLFDDKCAIWYTAMSNAEKSYFELLEEGATPQEARSVLPMSLKTEMVITANMREWRHIFKLRCAPAAHPQMREIMLPLLAEMYIRIPELFEDIYFLYKSEETKKVNKPVFIVENQLDYNLLICKASDLCDVVILDRDCNTLSLEKLKLIDFTELLIITVSNDHCGYKTQEYWRKRFRSAWTYLPTGANTLSGMDYKSRNNPNIPDIRQWVSHVIAFCSSQTK